MKIEICSTTRKANECAAWRFIQCALNAKGVVGIATGDTTKAIYEIVAQIYAAAPFPTENLQISAVDDYVGIEKGHIASCAERVRRQVQQPLGLRDDQLLLPERFSGTPQEVAAAYEAELNARGGVQVQFLGIGSDGHLGFCRPGTPLNSLAHAVLLPEDTRNMLHQKYALEGDKLPAYGVTLGLMSMMRMPELVVIATGSKKAQAVRQSICGEITSDVPASVLQLHPNVTWILDPEAAALLD